MLPDKGHRTVTEAFAALDALRSIELRSAVPEILKFTRASAIVVTRDVDDALALADRVVGLTGLPAAIAVTGTVGENATRSASLGRCASRNTATRAAPLNGRSPDRGVEAAGTFSTMHGAAAAVSSPQPIASGAGTRVAEGLVTSFMRQYEVPTAAIAVAKNGRLVHARAFGHQDLAKTGLRSFAASEDGLMPVSQTCSSCLRCRSAC